MLVIPVHVVIVVVLWCGSVGGEIDVETIAKNLDIKYEVISNLNGNDVNFKASVTLSNKGEQLFPKGEWELYFTGLYMVEPGHLYETTGRYDIPKTNLRVHRVNGALFKFTPLPSFEGLKSGETLTIPLVVEYWSVARTDTMPNWYIADANTGFAEIVQSTDTENLQSFTGNFDTEDKWKRFKDDRYNPWKPEERWNRNDVEDLGTVPKMAIPTPRKVVKDNGKRKLTKPLTDWVVYTASATLDNEVSILYDKLRWTRAMMEPESKYVNLALNGESSSEAYILDVDGEKEVITISSDSSAGIFYGVQTLLAILETESTYAPTIPSMRIEDSPRYGYRGMHMDVGRHFVAYEDIIKLIKAMGTYKLNKLHFHLTDDEGWRVEMPWCPYLTIVGAKQCHDLAETQCLIPQFGSKPDGTGRGSGFYSAEEYKSILRTAKANHIEVIPEVDMPGHARAAIKATEAYLKAAKEGLFNVTDAEAIQLSDPDDTSRYFSVQLYTDNAVNPCIDTTYTFVKKVVETFVDYHRDIQPLKVMHLGGDEVAHGAWSKSPACKRMLQTHTDLTDVSDLSEYFVKTISEVVRTVGENLTLGLWEDGAITSDEVPFDRIEIKTKSVLTHAWQNIWEWGAASRAYKLANAGYKVVMSQATHTYFDHPVEPDPEERGLYWATRFTNTEKTFAFMPDDLYANADAKRNGAPYSEKQLCQDTICVPLMNPANIVGMQGQIWTETIRTSDEIFGMIFPRFIALAERAWHKASWEDSKGEGMEADWRNFANTIGYRELARLDKMGINYRVPVPGAKVADGMVHMNSEFPGLEITYSSRDEPFKKMKYVRPVPASDVDFIQVRSSDGAREGRVVAMSSSASVEKPGRNIFIVFSAVASLVLFVVL